MQDSICVWACVRVYIHVRHPEDHLGHGLVVYVQKPEDHLWCHSSLSHCLHLSQSLPYTLGCLASEHQVSPWLYLPTAGITSTPSDLRLLLPPHMDGEQTRVLRKCFTSLSFLSSLFFNWHISKI